MGFFLAVTVFFANIGATDSVYAATGVPSAYMNSLAQLNEKYPAPRDQGAYNTCWACSAIGLAEFDLITDNGTADKSIDLSELQLAYFTYHNAEDAFEGTFQDKLQVSGNYLLAGGNLNYCSRTLLQWEGVIPESELPYSNAATVGTLGDDYAFGKNVAHLQNVYIINLHKNPSAVKREIIKHGAAGISLYLDETPVFDGSAVYAATRETVTTYCCPYSGGKYAANHAVNIVGWDDHFPASAFTKKPSGNGAWLVRNSWSNAAQNDITSYFWLSYYDAAVDDEAWIFDFDSADNYDFNYQYDGCACVYKALKTPTCANVFQVKGATNELLKAVSITLNEDTNVPYTIKVYTNLTNPAKPRSGILAAKVTGKTSYAGTYTVPLKKAVSMPKGTYYSIVVELGKNTAGIDVEYAMQQSGVTAQAYVDFNQSFLYNQGTWQDIADISDYYGIGNLCIKGYTTKTGSSIAKTEKLKAVSVTKTGVKLSWSKTKGAAGYEVYRATSKNGTYAKVASVSKTGFTDTKRKPGTTYYYKIRAYKKSGKTTVYGKLSTAVKVTTKK